MGKWAGGQTGRLKGQVGRQLKGVFSERFGAIVFILKMKLGCLQKEKNPEEKLFLHFHIFFLSFFAFSPFLFSLSTFIREGLSVKEQT